MTKFLKAEQDRLIRNWEQKTGQTWYFALKPTEESLYEHHERVSRGEVDDRGHLTNTHQ